MPKPTICQIHGAALGGAFELALACDFRTMAEDAVAGILEVRVGLLPDVGGCSRLPAVVGVGPREGADHDRQGDRRPRGPPDRLRQPDRPGRRPRGGHRRARGRAARGGAQGRGAGQADHGRGGQAGAVRSRWSRRWRPRSGSRPRRTSPRGRAPSSRSATRSSPAASSRPARGWAGWRTRPRGRPRPSRAPPAARPLPPPPTRGHIRAGARGGRRAADRPTPPRRSPSA